MSVLTLAPRAPRTTGCAKAGTRVGATFPSVLVAARAGAEWAWTLLHRAVAPALLGYLTASGVPNPEQALGAVFREAALGIHNFTGDEDSFRSWMFAAAHEHVFAQRRRHVTGRRDGAHDPTLQLPIGALRPEAQLAIAILPPEQRDVVLLRVFGDLSLHEVAAVVDRPVSSVRTLQHRAYARVRRMLPFSTGDVAPPPCTHPDAP